MSILVAKGVRKTYFGGETPVEAVRGVSLRLEAGEFVALMGPSGCGKSTLLHLCGAMDRATAGDVEIEGISVGDLSEERLTRLRRERVGFVFQFFNLLPTFTVADNIALPLLLSGHDGAECEERSAAIASRVGIAHRLRHFPQQLSGGEMQRAAIARAVVHRPALLIADEPTGNLDSENGARVLSLLSELHSESGVTVLLATHSPETASAACRILRMRDGIIDGTEGAAALPGEVRFGAPV